MAKGKTADNVSSEVRRVISISSHDYSISGGHLRFRTSLHLRHAYRFDYSIDAVAMPRGELIGGWLFLAGFPTNALTDRQPRLVHAITPPVVNFGFRGT
jgi:hypothetical protein